jgi:hypothetical protein
MLRVHSKLQFSQGHNAQKNDYLILLNPVG